MKTLILTLALFTVSCGNVPGSPSPLDVSTHPPVTAPGQCIQGTDPSCLTVIPTQPKPVVPPPTVGLNDVTVTVGQMAVLSASAILNGQRSTGYAWTFGDGTSTTSQSYAVQHRYVGLGTYTARVTVTDDRDLMASAEATVTVVPVPVIAPPPEPSTALMATVACTQTMAGSPSSPVAGSPLGCHVAVSEGSTQRTSQVTNVAWDYGDGSTLPTGGVIETHTYVVAGDYVIAVVVTISDGRNVAAQVNVTVK